jgi:hypothetical protein
MKKKNNSETEQLMQLHFSRLSEKEKRQYAGIESQKLGFGGKIYISKLFTISRNTLNRGLLELTQSTLYDQIPLGKQRRIGGGRKKILQ